MLRACMVRAYMWDYIWGYINRVQITRLRLMLSEFGCAKIELVWERCRVRVRL